MDGVFENGRGFLKMDGVFENGRGFLKMTSFAMTSFLKIKCCCCCIISKEYQELNKPVSLKMIYCLNILKNIEQR